MEKTSALQAYVEFLKWAAEEEEKKKAKRPGYGKAMGTGAAVGGGISSLLTGDVIGGPLMGAGIGALANRARLRRAKKD